MGIAIAKGSVNGPLVALIMNINEMAVNLEDGLGLDGDRCTGRERLIRSHSSAWFCFELSGNSN